MSATLKTTNTRIDIAAHRIEAAEQRIEALEAQTPDALTASLHKLAEEEAERRIRKFKIDLEQTTRSLVSKHFPETHDLSCSTQQGRDASVATYFPTIFIQESSALGRPGKIGCRFLKEDDLLIGLTNYLFQQRVKQLVQASEPPEKETSK